MKSWELLRELFAPKGIKHIAGLLGRSCPLVHKWTEPVGVDASGARNPLDVLALLMAATDAERLAHWVCSLAGGRFVPAAPVPPLRPEERLPACQRLMGELGEMVSAMGKLLPSGRLAAAEQESLRRVFAKLQTDMARLLQPKDGNEYAASYQLATASHPRPGSREMGGSRCPNRLPGGRCGFQSAQRN